VLQCVVLGVEHCLILCVHVWCSMFHYAAVFCRVFQSAALCSTLTLNPESVCCRLQCVAMCVLPCVAVCCSVMHFVALCFTHLPCLLPCHCMGCPPIQFICNSWSRDAVCENGRLMQHIAFGVSFNLNLKSQSSWSPFNGTWHKQT